MATTKFTPNIYVHRNRNMMMSKSPIQCYVTVIMVVLSLISIRVTGGWVDPDTAKEFYIATANTLSDKREYELVFSDEFEQEGRTFHDGRDPRWTAIHKNDYTNDALHFYSEENIKTKNGMLNITTEQKTNMYKAFNEKTKKFYSDAKYVQTGMVQGWNKFCFTGGIVEFSAQLPGEYDVGGLWPALWMLGNLARATYVGSSDYMWPFSYSKCDDKTRNSQEINGCTNVQHYGMKAETGRGAPEIDVLEAMPGEPGKLPNTHIERPYFSTSLQVAPGLRKDRPNVGDLPKHGHWYSHLEYGNVTNSSLNNFFYGVTLIHEPKSYTYQSDAISANTHIGKTHFKKQHKYRVEWEPPEEDGSEGYIKWYIDDLFVFGVSGISLELTGTEIPSEPMYLIMNTAVSSSWGFPKPCPGGCDCACFRCGDEDCDCGLPDGFCGNFPAYFLIDYVRVWQAKNESKHNIGCSTEERPTELFIKGHQERYMEEGDRRPLKPIQRGGGSCSSNADCAGPKNGICSDRNLCQCREGYTGPRCLADDSFYDYVYKPEQTTLRYTGVFLPPGFLVAFIFLAVGFGVALSYFSKLNIYEQIEYDEVPTIEHFNPDNDVPPQVMHSYQNSASIDYTLPKQKMINYCVIDKRLIDT